MATNIIRRHSWAAVAVIVGGLMACGSGEKEEEKVIEAGEEAMEVAPAEMPSDQGEDVAKEQPADMGGEKPMEGDMGDDKSAEADKEMVGDDKDDHGCIGSAGFMWCERDGECVKPMDLAEKHSLEKTADAVKAYCESEPEE